MPWSNGWWAESSPTCGTRSGPARSSSASWPRTSWPRRSLMPTPAASCRTTPRRSGTRPPTTSGSSPWSRPSSPRSGGSRSDAHEPRATVRPGRPHRGRPDGDRERGRPPERRRQDPGAAPDRNFPGHGGRVAPRRIHRSGSAAHPQHLFAAGARGQRRVGAALPEDARRGVPTQVPAMKRIVVAISGASGAALASGSFKTDGMVVVPCSIKTAAGIAHCLADTLMGRAADVTLKEGRPLILVVRETPLHLGHLRVLTALAEMGVVLMPPMPAFYNRPKQIDDLVVHTLARVLDRLGLPQTLVPEWQGTPPRVPPPRRA